MLLKNNIVQAGKFPGESSYNLGAFANNIEFTQCNMVEYFFHQKKLWSLERSFWNKIKKCSFTIILGQSKILAK